MHSVDNPNISSVAYFAKQAVHSIWPLKINNPDRIKEIIQLLQPLSLAYQDLEGNTYQLWKRRKTLLLSISDDEGKMFFIPGQKVHNALQPKETGNELLSRLENQKLKKWTISYNAARCEAFVWPYLIAAGKDDPIEISTKKIHQIGDHFHKHGRQMGLESKKEYDKAAREFAQEQQANPKARIEEGSLIERGGTKGPLQRAITFAGKTVIIDVETGQIKNFYLGSENRGLLRNLDNFYENLP